MKMKKKIINLLPIFFVSIFTNINCLILCDFMPFVKVRDSEKALLCDSENLRAILAFTWHLIV